MLDWPVSGDVHSFPSRCQCQPERFTMNRAKSRKAWFPQIYTEESGIVDSL